MKPQDQIVIATDRAALRWGPDAVNCLAVDDFPDELSGMVAVAVTDGDLGTVVYVDARLPAETQDNACVVSLAVLEDTCAPSVVWLGSDGELAGTVSRAASDGEVRSADVRYSVRL